MINNQTHKMITWAVLATFLFTGGLWIIDINISVANLAANGINAQIGTLVFENLSPRISYHIGILMTVLGFFIMNANYLHYMRNYKKEMRR